ncbi:unnamed protein product [Bubo scandiacus]
MFRSQADVLCCFLHQKIALSILNSCCSVCNIKTLQVLVLLNNLIREIPNVIHTPNSQLPSICYHIFHLGFLLEDLQYLHTAYNDISFIPSVIKNHSFIVCAAVDLGMAKDFGSPDATGTYLDLEGFPFTSMPAHHHAIETSFLRLRLDSSTLESDLDYSRGTANGIK